MRVYRPLIVFLLFTSACGTAGNNPSNTVANAAKPAVSSPVNPPDPKDGDYFGKGKVTKIDPAMPSVGLDHGEIPGLMPAMQMEFFVKDKTLLDGLVIGESIDFTIAYKGGTETITKIGKAK